MIGPLRRPGISVAILGPDGAGKSSLVAAVREAYPRPVTILKMSQAVPPSRGPRVVRWVIGTLRTVRVLLGSRLAAVRGRIIVWDRHPLEDRYTAIVGRRVLGPRRRWLARLAPSPDLVIVLDAAGETLQRRRREHTVRELERFRATYRRLAAERAAVVLDASLPPERLRDAVMDELESLERRLPA